MRRGFTLLEVVVAVTIVLILATLALASYRQVVDNAYQEICATNQILHLKCIERHFLETNVAPASLGDIKLEHYREAYAEVMKEAGWFTKFSYFFARLNTPKEAYADIEDLKDLVDWEKMQAYGIPREVFRCPADRNAGISYGINTNLKNFNSWNAIPQDEPIIGDCDSDTFASEAALTDRHIKNFGITNVALSATKAGRIRSTERQTAKGKNGPYPGKGH
ncbi:MAG: type II secretion system protein [Candidatus Omnitrophica bacterium]|nr:type II secretion system protein [Candidatus Omnitrophota bacterium]